MPTETYYFFFLILIFLLVDPTSGFELIFCWIQFKLALSFIFAPSFPKLNFLLGYDFPATGYLPLRPASLCLLPFGIGGLRFLVLLGWLAFGLNFKEAPCMDSRLRIYFTLLVFYFAAPITYSLYLCLVP